MTWQTSFRIEIPDGSAVRGEIVGPRDRAHATPILFVREDSLPRDCGFYPHVTERLVRTGFAVATLERAEGEAIEPALELAAVKAFVAQAVAGSIDGRLAANHLGLLGHGLGAGLALLAAAWSVELGGSGAGAVPGVVALGCCATLDRGDERPRRAYAERVRSDAARFSLESAVRSYPGRLVLVHGEEDYLVPIDEAERLYHWSRKDRARFVLMEKVGHSFGARDPMLEMTKEVDRIGKIVDDFFHSVLG